MKSNMKCAKKLLGACIAIGAGVLVIFAGIQRSSALTDEEYKAYSDADIYFYSNDCVGGGGPGTICGSNAREKYWTAISKYVDDPIKIAGILGNLAAEGNFQPALWEYSITNSDGTLEYSWDYIYNGGLDGTKGVGAFAITSGLSKYLHTINDEAPELIKYFKNPVEYSIGATHPGFGLDDEHPTWGDLLLEKIGAADYDRLVEFEVDYAMGPFEPATTQEYLETNFSTASEAAYWWMDRWERPGYRNEEDRKKAAEQALDDFKNFQCSGSSSSASGSTSANSGSVSISSVPGSDIIWIGDSDSAFAGEKLLDNTFPGLKESGGWGPSFNDSESYIQSCKFINSVGCGDSQPNRSGLDILEQIIKQDNLRPYLVFALGGNGGWDEASMNKFLKLIEDKDVQVVITTAKYRTVDYPEGNELARKVAEEHPNIYLADIAANYSDGYFDEDDIEFNAEGSQMFVRTIKEALEEASGNGGCTTYTGEYPEYRQYDPRWGTLPYGSTNFHHGACGATSMAVITTIASGQDVLPTDIADLLEKEKDRFDEGKYLYYAGYMRELDPVVCEKYGCETEPIDISGSSSEVVARLKKYLQEGWMIHVSGGCAGGGHSSTCPYSADGHYVALLALKGDDTVVIEDPGWGDTAIQEYKLSDVVKGLGAAQAVRGGGSKGGSCENYCKDSGSGGAINGGLTESQAQKLVDYYNSDAVDGSNLPFGKMNCVSFVKWFIEEFTDLTYDGGNGKDVAHNLATANNLEEGNEPRPFSVFSVTTIGSTMCGGFKCGHTGIVVAVDGDMITTAEAALDRYNGTVFTANKSGFSNAEYGKTYTYIDSAIDKEKLNKIIGK